MALEDSLISQFAKLTNGDKKKNDSVTLSGTIAVRDNTAYVKIDGSDILTPMTNTVEVKDEDRVLVMIKDHQATVVGNATDRSVGIKRVENLESDAKDAGKTATNFIEGTTEGLIVGNVTAEVLGRNILIAADDINVRNGDDVLATFSDSLIELGKNSKFAKIDLCSGSATLYNEYEGSIGPDLVVSDVYSRLVVESEHSIKLATSGAIYHNVYKRDENGNNAMAAIHLSTYTPWSGTTMEQWSNNPFPDLDMYTECNSGTLYSKNQVLMSQGGVTLKSYAQSDYASTWVPNAFEHTSAIDLSGKAGTLVLRATNGITLNNVTDFKNHLYIANGKFVRSYTAAGEPYTMLHTNASDRIVVGYGSYELSKGFTAVYGNTVNITTRDGFSIDGKKLEWVKATATAGSNVTIGNQYCVYNAALDMAIIRINVTIKPTDAVSAGTDIVVAKVTGNIIPNYINALSNYVGSTNARRWVTCISTTGNIIARPSTSLNADTEYNLTITGAYPVSL